MTQTARVYKALTMAGGHGITQGDFLGVTVDDGPSITRVAARIEELRGRGVQIDASTVRRQGFTVYRLAGREGIEAGWQEAWLCHRCLAIVPVQCSLGRMELVLIDPDLEGQTMACAAQTERQAA